MSQIKTSKELTFMHDTLSAVLGGEFTRPYVSRDDLDRMAICLNTLCWVMNHPSGDILGNLFESLLQDLAAQGYAYEDSGATGKPFSEFHA